jgi:hypothetical protein
MRIATEEPLPEDVASLMALATDDRSTIARLSEVAASLRVAELDDVVHRLRRCQAAKERLAFVPADALRRELALRHLRLEGRS